MRPGPSYCTATTTRVNTIVEDHVSHDTDSKPIRRLVLPMIRRWWKILPTAIRDGADIVMLIVWRVRTVARYHPEWWVRSTPHSVPIVPVVLCPDPGVNTMLLYSPWYKYVGSILIGRRVVESIIIIRHTNTRSKEGKYNNNKKFQWLLLYVWAV